MAGINYFLNKRAKGKLVTLEEHCKNSVEIETGLTDGDLCRRIDAMSHTEFLRHLSLALGRVLEDNNLVNIRDYD